MRRNQSFVTKKVDTKEDNIVFVKEQNGTVLANK